MDMMSGPQGQALLRDLHAFDEQAAEGPEVRRQVEDFIARLIDLTREDTQVDAWRRNWVANAIGATHLGWYSAAVMALEVPLLHRDYDGPCRIQSDDLEACLGWLRRQPVQHVWAGSC